MNNIKIDINDVIKKHGLTIDDLVECGKRGLSAVKSVRDDMGCPTEAPDYNVQHKFFATFMELLGYLKSHGDINIRTDNAEKKEAEEAFNKYRSVHGMG